MFCKKIRQIVSKNNISQQEVEQLQQRVETLSFENRQLTQQIEQLENDPNAQFEHLLLKSAIECINQVEGVRANNKNGRDDREYFRAIQKGR